MMKEIHIIRKRHLRALRIFRGKNHNLIWKTLEFYQTVLTSKSSFTIPARVSLGIFNLL